MSTVNSGGGQTPAPDVTPGQTPLTSGQTPTTPPVSSEDEPLSVAKAKELREELKQRRLTEEKALASLKKLQDAQLTEDQRKEQELNELKTQAQQWEQQRQQLLIDRAVLLIAPSVGIELELALELIKPASIKFKDGEVDEESVKKALQTLLEKHPSLAVKPAQEGNQQQQRPPAPRVPSTTPPASSVGQTSQETVKDLKRYTLADAFKQTRQQ